MLNLTREDRVTYNKMIAAFLDGEVREVWKIQGRSEEAWFGEVAEKWRKEKLRINVGNAILEGQLEFHSSWEWLMPVLEKISNLRNLYQLFGTGHTYRCMIDCMVPSPKSIVHQGDDLFECAYEAVLEYVKFYNGIN